SVALQYHTDLRALTTRAGDFQLAAHLVDPLAHSPKTDTVMSIFGFESVAVVAKFQTKFFRLVSQSRFEVASVSVFERVGQGFLSNMQKIFLPALGKIRKFALRFKRSVKRCSNGGVLNST